MPIRCSASRQGESVSRRRSVLGAVPAEKDTVVAAIAVAIRNFVFVPDGKVFAFDVAAGSSCGGEVGVLVERCEGNVGSVAIAIEVKRVRQPGATDAPVLEKRNVFAVILESGFEKRGNISFRNAALFV